MANIDYFAIFVMVMVAISALFVFVLIATLPGSVARDRGHPQAEAINIGGWMGALFGGILWPVIMVWAFYKPKGSPDTQVDTSVANTTAVDELKEQNAALQKQVEDLAAQLAKQKGSAS